MDGINDHHRHHPHRSDWNTADISVIAASAAAVGSGSSFRMKHLLNEPSFIEQRRSDDYIMGCGGRDGSSGDRDGLAVGFDISRSSFPIHQSPVLHSNQALESNHLSDLVHHHHPGICSRFPTFDYNIII